MSLVEQLLMSRLKQMPGYNKVMKQIEDAGGDPKKAFEQQAQSLNKNPDKLLKELDPQGFMNTLR